MLLSPVPNWRQSNLTVPFRHQINILNLRQFLSLLFFPCCFLTGNPCRRCVVQYWRSYYFKMVLAVYISLDSHLVVPSLSNKTTCFPVYPPCQKFSKKQIFSIMLEIFGRNPLICVVFCFRKEEIYL